MNYPDVYLDDLMVLMAHHSTAKEREVPFFWRNEKHLD